MVNILSVYHIWRFLFYKSFLISFGKAKIISFASLAKAEDGLMSHMIDIQEKYHCVIVL